MNVTEDDLRKYIEVFHDTLDATAKQYLPERYRDSLLHLSLLPAQIIGYVSTQFGAGIEYKPAECTEIKTVRGSARVEYLFTQAPARVSASHPMFIVPEGHGASFRDAGGVFNFTLESGFPFWLKGPNTGIRIGNAIFEFGATHRKVTYAEIFGNRTQDFWSQTQAVARAKDEVLAALGQLNRADARHLSRGLHREVQSAYCSATWRLR